MLTHRDLAAPDIWERSLERSRRRRITAVRDRRRDTRRKHAATAATAAMVAAPAAPMAAAQTSGGGGGGSQASGDSQLSAESPANRAIDDGPRNALLLFKLGSRGDAVFEIQRALVIYPDGVFGAETDAAVRSFQARSGLEVDGIVGPKTWTALFGLQQAAASVSGDGSGSQPQPAVETGVDVGTGVDGGSQASASRASAQASRPPASGRTKADLIFVVDNGASASRGAPKGSGSPAAPRGVQRKVERFTIGGRPGDDAKPGAAVCGSTKIGAPVRGIKTSPFGPRWGRMHEGVDIAAPSGRPVRAAACGVVSQLLGSRSSGGYGNFVCIRHTSRFTTCYAHLSGFSTFRGERVRKGEVIGYVGCTGRCTGSHLHFETRVDGRARNPQPYLSGRGIPGKPTTSSSKSRSSGTSSRATARSAPLSASSGSSGMTETSYSQPSSGSGSSAPESQYESGSQAQGTTPDETQTQSGSGTTQSQGSGGSGTTQSQTQSSSGTDQSQTTSASQTQSGSGSQSQTVSSGSSGSQSHISQSQTQSASGSSSDGSAGASSESSEAGASSAPAAPEVDETSATEAGATAEAEATTEADEEEAGVPGT